MSVRVRFAPSPTGFLHIGGARTALYNWLFARQNKGTFVLRIEDTDEERSTKPAVDAILEGLTWLGLDWDEGPELSVKGGESRGLYGPYFQMQRLDVYKQYAEQLIKEGNAYYCYCSREELKAERERAQAESRPPKYNERCRALTDQERQAFEKEGRRPVIRFKNDFKEIIKFKDIVKGEISFDPTLLDDFVIMKPTGVPIYNFAVVVDDYQMKISHVIRGDDHISNTPRQIMIYKSLNWELPQYAHIPMILGSDSARLSKRHGATSVINYRDEGYLPDAMVNYLALLGWSTSDSQQLFFDQELIEKFKLEKCSPSASIFDSQKLLWINGEYIRKKTKEEFYNLALPWLKKAGLVGEEIEDKDKLLNILELEKEKAKLLTDIPDLYSFMLNDKMELEEKAINKVLKKEGAKEILLKIIPELKKLKDFSSDNLENLVREFCENNNVKTGQVFHPLRVATSGRTKGPSLFHYMEVLGKEKIIKRIEETIQIL